jgi:hypothetical protein
MSSKIREATEDEKSLATKFSDKVDPVCRDLVEEAEDMGFRVLYKGGRREYISILTPQQKILTWDYNPRSLDNLEETDSNLDLRDAGAYLGLVSMSYLKNKISEGL